MKKTTDISKLMLVDKDMLSGMSKAFDLYNILQIEKQAFDEYLIEVIVKNGGEE